MPALAGVFLFQRQATSLAEVCFAKVRYFRYLSTSKLIYAEVSDVSLPLRGHLSFSVSLASNAFFVRDLCLESQH